MNDQVASASEPAGGPVGAGASVIMPADSERGPDLPPYIALMIRQVRRRLRVANSLLKCLSVASMYDPQIDTSSAGVAGVASRLICSALEQLDPSKLLSAERKGEAHGSPRMKCRKTVRRPGAAYMRGRRRKASRRPATNLVPRSALPASAKITWRVLEHSGRLDRDIVHDETTIEREALKTFRSLRGSGLPVLVSRWQIYRVRIKPKAPLDPERFAFIEAFSPQDACGSVATAPIGFDRVLLSDARACVSAKSTSKLIEEVTNA